MEVVVDTNVIVDALQGDDACKLVLTKEDNGYYTFAVSDFMREELIHVFRRIFSTLLPEQVLPLCTILLRLFHRARRVNPTRTARLCAHAADDEFLSCAVEAPTEFLGLAAMNLGLTGWSR